MSIKMLSFVVRHTPYVINEPIFGYTDNIHTIIWITLSDLYIFVTIADTGIILLFTESGIIQILHTNYVSM